MQNKILSILKLAIKEKYSKNLNLEDLNIEIESNFLDKKDFGDFSTNIAFKLAGILKNNPKLIAHDLKETILKQNHKNFFEKIEVAGSGFLNFWINKDEFLLEFNKILKNKNFGKQKFKNKKIIFEYSDPNIAKKMHVGHLRGTIIGDALANIYEFLGYKVIRWNYLGDWGTQFGYLIAAYKLWGNKTELEKNPINTMLKLYIRFHHAMKKNPELKKMGQEEFRLLELKNKENLKLWSWFRRESILEFKKIYKLLNVKFDIWIGESFYEKDISKIINLLLNLKIAQKNEGAIIVPLEKFNLPPALILKSDEASLYLTRDIANLIFRFKKFKPDKIVYVVGNEQTLHFNQLFAIAQLLNLDSSKLIHLKYGLVLGENKKKLKTREGNLIFLEDVLNKAIKLAFKIVNKNKNLTNKQKEKIAQIVGIGAIKYNDLKEHRRNNIVFDWSKMIDLRGQSAPYIQYSYARIQSILKKSKIKLSELNKVKIKNLNSELEINLIKKILIFPEILNLSAKNYLTSYLANYLYELAILLNKFYETTKILKEKENKIKLERLKLIHFVSFILKTGLNLLGIEVVDKM
ncbi:MAG: arginine--tRNA ligase [Patescibacteria group bacterium]|nr:arginine--tRNA ligase [Patescibacteria group bacterium]MDW8279587.1 arginine--tRNA ligase [bacterium]